jgi:hypothetical protein
MADEKPQAEAQDSDLNDHFAQQGIEPSGSGSHLSDELDPILNALRMPRRYLSDHPTFTPQNFYDQIQFVLDAGNNKFLDLYFNGQWNQFALSASSVGGMEVTLPYAEVPSVGDLVSLIESQTAYNVLFQNAVTGNVQLGVAVNGTKGHAVSFTPPITIAANAWTLSTDVFKSGTPTDDLTLALYADSAGLPGSVLVSTTIPHGSVTGSAQPFTLTGNVALTRGTTYWLGISRGTTDAANYYDIKTASGWTFYYGMAVYTGAGPAWTTSTGAFYFSLSANVAGGLYKTFDTPNNLHMQGGTLGIVKSVDTGAATAVVVIGGAYSSSGTPFTLGSYYYASQTSPGALSATEGHTLVGYALSTSKLLIYPVKKHRLIYSGSPLISGWTAAGIITFDVMTGFKAQRAEASLESSHGGGSNALVFYGRTGIGGVRITNTGTIPNAAGFFNVAGVQGCSGTVDISSSRYSAQFALTGGSSSSDLTGNIVFEN